MRWDSPFVLAFAGTLAIHVFLAVGADVLVVLHPITNDAPAKHIEIFDIEPPPRLVEPPPPPVARAAPIPHDTPRTVTKATPAVRAAAAPSHEPPPPEAPPPTTDPAPGGGPVVAMDDIAPSAVGVGVARGPRTTGHIGRGGTGEGTGLGGGSGAGQGPPPVSVATIKRAALPRGDYSYSEAKDYPAEAKRLGIEGAIRVKLVVDETGRVKSAVLLNQLGHGLDELALARARQIQFDPARDTDDHAVTSVVVWTFTMTLPK